MVVAQVDIIGVLVAAKPATHSTGANGVDRVPVLDVKEVTALAEPVMVRK